MSLADEGVEVGVWAPDQSVVQTDLLAARSSVRRMIGTEREALIRFGKIDVLHDNGLWLPHNHRLAVLAERCGIPRVVSTRGMLEPWALGHKRLKKRIAWPLYQQRDLKRARCHHATAEAEAEHVRCQLLGVPVVVIPNGVDLPPEHRGLLRRFADQDRRSPLRTALFLGRIHPIKGLLMLIEAWARLRPQDWVLRIAGPDEGGHQKEVEKAVRDAGLCEIVSFAGPVEDRAKTAEYLRADLFVLPTHSENFGIVVAEALAHGVPVLTTTGAPWPALTTVGCGWRVNVSVNGIVEGLRAATEVGSESLAAMGAKGRAFVSAEFSWKRVAKLMLSLYEGVLTTPATTRLRTVSHRVQVGDTHHGTD